MYRTTATAHSAAQVTVRVADGSDAPSLARLAAIIELLQLRAAQLRGEARSGGVAGSYAGRLRALLGVSRSPSLR